MKKIGFIGVHDKTDLILNIAKVIETMGKKVIVIDSTVNRKSKYIVPVINPTVSYITEFEDIDIAVGFEDFGQIKQCLSLKPEEQLNYDVALFDIDTIELLNNFEMTKADKNYFVTSFDLFSLRKGLETLEQLKEPLEVTKILFSRGLNKEEDEYLSFISLGYKVYWKKEIIYFPLEQGDQSAIIENQLVSKIKFKKLSTQYKESLFLIVEQILKEERNSEIKRAIKTIEKY